MNTDVLVVGAGPTGLAMALWLNAQGIRFRIIDRSSGPGETSRATAVHARTLELYRQIGIGDAVAKAGFEAAELNMWAGGKRRAHVELGGIGGELTPYPFVLIFPQDLHERLLVETLRESGIEVERQTELIDFTQDEGSVTARLRLPSGEIETCNALYLTGCDGARSTVRKQLGASFEGGTYDQLFYVADITTRNDPAYAGLHVSFDGPDFMLIMPYGEPGKLRLVGTVRPENVGKSEALTFDDVGQEGIRTLGLDLESVNWFSTYRVHHRVTERFSHGRAFLLGDAAHVHSPAGGQGMNTGIGDAINLAWKLAAVIKGTADQDLIESFEKERPVFARKLVDTTDRAFTFVTKQSSLAEFIRTHVAPVFMKTVYRIGPAREAFFSVLSQILISYPESPLSVGSAGKVDGGERLPFVRFDDHDNYASLSAIRWQVHVYGAVSPELQRWCETHEVPLHTFVWRNEFAEAGMAENAIYLLRPDSYVGLADKSGDWRAVETYFAERKITPGQPKN